jgi:CheY-like chemotaxis protein
MADERFVLIVDDEEDVRETMCEVVQMAGYTAVGAANGAEALEILARTRPCLVVLDLLMPVMNGNEFLKAMRKHTAWANVPVVVSTSAPDRAPPGIAVVPKPIDIQALWDFVRRSCSRIPGGGEAAT